MVRKDDKAVIIDKEAKQMLDIIARKQIRTLRAVVKLALEEYAKKHGIIVTKYTELDKIDFSKL